ncbi:MAG: hypothetical protein HYV07_28365 [Deltaproteobacteria bacterium]|nr:hypothetical protein [Deltaproteobacteria bacterium]
MNTRNRWLLAATLAGTSALAPSALADKPPFTDDKAPGAAEAKATAPKPKERSWNVETEGEAGKLNLGFKMVPGIPDPDQVVEVTISANGIPATPHPRYGRSVPLEGAKLIVELETPGHQVIARYLAHPVPLAAGRYAIHTTPLAEGIHTLRAKGTTVDGKTFEAEVKLPVKVWPLPPELAGSGAAEAGSQRKPLKL